MVTLQLCSTNQAPRLFIHAIEGRRHYPSPASATPQQPTTGGASEKKEKKGVVINWIDRRTRPIARGGANQREPLASPDSLSPHASLDTLFCRPHVRLRSSVNPTGTIGGGKWGKSGVSAALGDIPCPDRPSDACRSQTMMYHFIGSDFLPFLHCIIA